MRLIFYSGGDHQENQELDAWLLRLVGSNNPKVTFIPSCYEHREEDIEDFKQHLGPIGIQRVQVFDVDQPHSSADLNAALDAQLVYLSGGNTFYFLNALRKAKALKALKRFAETDGVLVGKSAGAIIMTPHITTAAVPEFDSDDNEVGLRNLDAMGLVKFEFFPHYPGQVAYDREFEAYTRMTDAPLYACDDGCGIVVYERQMIFVGDVVGFFDGRKFKLMP